MTQPDNPAFLAPTPADQPAATPAKGRNRNRTRAIRARMALTGENYTTAMRALDRERAEHKEGNR